MRIVFAVVCALLVPTISAAQINLFWDDCSVGGVETKRFACDRNDPTNTLVMSFIAPAGVDSFVGVGATLYLYSDESTVPSAWWQLRNQTGQTGQCRHGALSSNANFLSGPYSCANPYPSGSIGGIATYQVGYLGVLNRIRLIVAHQTAGDERQPLVPGVEYYAAKVVIDDRSTTGDGACTGCLEPMGIELTRLQVAQANGSPGGDYNLELAATSRWVGWQCDFNTFGGRHFDCSTPTRAPSWGAVKALYR